MSDQSNPDEDRSAAFDRHRPYLTGVAYRMLGSFGEAEDMVQETYLRWHRTEAAEIRAPRAWLTTALTRLCIDHLRQARRRREAYVGPWLPEPVPTGTPDTPLARIEQGEDLSIALLMVLERLAPAERAAFILREVFDYDYPEIARIIDAGEANCRQIVHRARARVQAERPRFAASAAEHNALLQRFTAACADGDLDGLIGLFADDITLWSDGGGKAKAARNPIDGADSVARFLLGILRKAPAGTTAALAEINGEPGIVTYVDGRPFGVLTLEIENRRIRRIAVMVNPDKLAQIAAAG